MADKMNRQEALSEWIVEVMPHRKTQIEAVLTFGLKLSLRTRHFHDSHFIDWAINPETNPPLVESRPLNHPTIGGTNLIFHTRQRVVSQLFENGEDLAAGTRWQPPEGFAEVAVGDDLVRFHSADFGFELLAFFLQCLRRKRASSFHRTHALGKKHPLLILCSQRGQIASQLDPFCQRQHGCLGCNVSVPHVGILIRCPNQRKRRISEAGRYPEPFTREWS